MNNKLFPARAIEHVACKPSGHSEYDSLSGYVTKQFVSEWQDASGTRWRKTVTIINLGKPDRGRRQDPDAMIEEEELGLIPVDHRYDNMAEKIRQAALERQGELVPKLVAYLEEHGPMSTIDMARDVLGRVNTSRVRNTLRNNPGTFVYLGGQQREWWLVGRKHRRHGP